jgi:nucleotidyltransferase/DNA polymerase involved in DNA repair
LTALQKCPRLVVLSYDFERIEKCSRQIYEILIEKSGFLQAVSCDEAIIDVTEQAGDDLIGYAEMIRKEIYSQTGCTASIGIGFNMLTARIATYSAKPNGIFRITRGNVHDVLNEFKVAKLPGVGYVKRKRFEELGVDTCGDAMSLSESDLKKEFGGKLGKKLFEFIRGIDSRSLENRNEAICISVEINWAVRFTNLDSLKQFMTEMAKYLERRMEGGIWTGLQVTIKKRDYKGEPGKYLGCGRCITFNKTRTRQGGYKDYEQVSKDSFTMFMEMRVDPCEVRGIGLQLKHSVVKLLAQGQKVLDFTKPNERNYALAEFKRKYRGTDPFTINPILFPTMKLDMLEDMVKAGVPIDLEKRELLDTTEYLPTCSQIDPEVLAALPKSIRMEQIAIAKLKSKQKKINQVEEVFETGDLMFPKLGGETDFHAITKLVEDWVETWKNGQPLEEDIEQILIYLETMVDSCQLDKAVVILGKIVTPSRKNGKERQTIADCKALILQRFKSIVFDFYQCDLDFNL